MSLLTLDRVVARKGGQTILQHVSLTVAAGEVVVILGPSGCGKSTLLRTINGLDPISDGYIQVAGSQFAAANFNGRNIAGANAAAAPHNATPDWQQLRRRVGMVFQHYQLFPHLSVLENVLLAPRLAKLADDASLQQRALSLLSQVGMADKATALPRQLSGGQQQRVAIARALCMQPELMLFDEITASLDPEMVIDVLEVLKTLAGSGMTMLIVTHELGFARAVADRIVFMDAGQIVEQASPAAFFAQPQHPRAQQFLARHHLLQQHGASL